jgi:hypothetical protein
MNSIALLSFYDPPGAANGIQGATETTYLGELFGVMGCAALSPSQLAAAGQPRARSALRLENGTDRGRSRHPEPAAHWRCGEGGVTR